MTSSPVIVAAVEGLRRTLRELGACVDRGIHLSNGPQTDRVCDAAEQLLREAALNVEAMAEACEIALSPPLHMDVAVAEMRATLQALGRCVDRGRDHATCFASKKLCRLADQLLSEAMRSVETIAEACEVALLPPPLPRRPNAAKQLRSDVLSTGWA